MNEILYVGVTLSAFLLQLNCFNLYWQISEAMRLTSGSNLMKSEITGSMEKYSFTTEYSIQGQGPAVLISHGSPGGYDQAQAFCKYLDLTKNTCIAVSRLGYLRSTLDSQNDATEHPEPPLSTDFFDINTQSFAFKSLLNDLGITDKVVVIGTSGGGPAAQAFCYINNEQCAGQIMISAISKPWSESEDSFLENSDFLLNLLSALGSSFPQLFVYSLVKDPEQRRLILENPAKLQYIAESAKTISLLRFRKNGKKHDYQIFETYKMFKYDAQKLILTPTLVIHGVADEAVPISHARHIKEMLPQTKLVTFQNAEHAIFITHLDEISKEVQSFLADIGHTN